MEYSAVDGSDIQHPTTDKTETVYKPAKNVESETENTKKAEKVSFFQLFRYATCVDILLLIIGVVGAVIHGVGSSVVMIVFSDVLKRMSQTTVSIEMMCDANGTAPDDTLLEPMKTISFYYIGLAAITFVAAYAHVTLLRISSEKQVFYMRKLLMKNILRQDLRWFDENTPGKLSSYQSESLTKISSGLGSELGNLIKTLSATIASITIAFVYQWKLSLVMISVTPVLGIAIALTAKVTKDMTQKELDAYSGAGDIAEEAISSIRTVVAFGGETKECQRYEYLLGLAKKAGIIKGVATGCSTGFFLFSVFAYYSLGFWYGAKLIREEGADISEVLVAFFSIFIGGVGLGSAGPNMQHISEAQTAAYEVFGILDTEPEIDNLSTSGKPVADIKGAICFRDVFFSYPSRPDIPILSGLNFEAEIGKTVALVGASGCGKSTVIQLVQRLYDIDRGEILIGGNDIKEYNVGSLRKLFGVVSQEPVLFGASIYENIRNGDEKATDEDIITAAKEANAHDFIEQLPEKYNTLVGQRGAQLSGGQKQRLAIARALVRKPLFLLLDEATSALDTQSEMIVQSALEKVQSGRTTLVVAHRLSTIRSADTILAFKDGVVVERGTHEELIEKDGLYCSLVKAQSLTTEETKETEKKEICSNEQRKDSVVSVKDVKEETSEDDKDLPDPSTLRIFKMNLPEWPFIFIGCIAATINGGFMPAFALIFSEFIGAFGNPDDTDVNKYVLYILLLAIIFFIVSALQYSMFGISGERLTMTVRMGLFKAILRQEIAWFDKDMNNTGVLCSRLSVDSGRIKANTGEKIGMLLQNTTNLVTALVIAFVYGWQLALLIIGFIPVIALSAALENKLLRNTLIESSSALEEATTLSMEAFQNIKTVFTLSIEMKIYDKFMKIITVPHKNGIKAAFKAGIGFAFSQSLIYLIYAAIFYVGAVLITKCHMDFTELLKVFSSLIFGALALGQASAMAPDFAKVKESSARIFYLLDRVPTIDSYSDKGNKKDNFQSKIEFNNVEFCYPNRPNVKVLQGLNLEIHQGETVALVGQSGCGKSTCMQLLERFYNPTEGNLLLDGSNVNDLNLKWLRQQMAIVSQEPVLFSCSIRENIEYGDLSRTVTFDEIVNAAQKANIHSFIDDLPEGYSTKAGAKGSQLSGGQKQRIAIARALIRNPKILLLDEATSALDTESEKVVQEALDKAREGRTCLVIAHRLSTIKNSDKIAVIVNGKVQEIGTHNELEKEKGVYFELLSNQTL
ncbi:multidrug resistance protein 1A-like [Argonauta hians]